MTHVKASLSIELLVVCPHCEEMFDLFPLDGGRLNDDGFLLKNACPDGYWGNSHEQFEVEVQCPDCKGEVKIQGIEW